MAYGVPDTVVIRTRPRPRISARRRFLILRRDGFRCYYCGAEPGEAFLEVDHICPVALGGRTAPQNLVTSCMTCNGGKGALHLACPDHATEAEEPSAMKVMLELLTFEEMESIIIDRGWRLYKSGLRLSGLIHYFESRWAQEAKQSERLKRLRWLLNDFPGNGRGKRRRSRGAA